MMEGSPENSISGDGQQQTAPQFISPLEGAIFRNSKFPTMIFLKFNKLSTGPSFKSLALIS